MVKAIDKAGYKGKIKIGMDVAASEFFDEGAKKYDLNNKEKGHPHYVNNEMDAEFIVFMFLFVCFLVNQRRIGFILFETN